MFQRDGQPSGDALVRELLGRSSDDVDRRLLAAPFSDAVGSESGAGRLQRYTCTLAAILAPSASAPEPTPTRNATLPFRRGGFASLAAALDYAAQGETGLNFFDARGHLTARLPYRDLRDRARRLASRLTGGGMRRGERLVIVADTWAGFCVAFFAAQYAGVLPVPVAVPVGLGAKESYVAQLRRQIVTADAVGILAPDDLAAFAVAAAAGTSVRFVGTLSVFEALPESPDEHRPLGAGERFSATGATASWSSPAAPRTSSSSTAATSGRRTSNGPSRRCRAACVSARRSCSNGRIDNHITSVTL
jgi:fatty-acyl-CoA synthase